MSDVHGVSLLRTGEACRDERTQGLHQRHPVAYRAIVNVDLSPVNLADGPREAPPAERVTVVTGAAQGLGRSIALELAPKSAGMLLVDIDEANLDESAEELRATGHNVETLVIDLTAAGSAA